MKNKLENVVPPVVAIVDRFVKSQQVGIRSYDFCTKTYQYYFANLNEVNDLLEMAHSYGRDYECVTFRPDVFEALLKCKTVTKVTEYFYEFTEGMLLEKENNLISSHKVAEESVAVVVEVEEEISERNYVPGMEDVIKDATVQTLSTKKPSSWGYYYIGDRTFCGQFLYQSVIDLARYLGLDVVEKSEIFKRRLYDALPDNYDKLSKSEKNKWINLESKLNGKNKYLNCGMNIDEANAFANKLTEYFKSINNSTVVNFRPFYNMKGCSDYKTFVQEDMEKMAHQTV